MNRNIRTRVRSHAALGYKIARIALLAALASGSFVLLAYADDAAFAPPGEIATSSGATGFDGGESGPALVGTGDAHSALESESSLNANTATTGGAQESADTSIEASNLGTASTTGDGAAMTGGNTAVGGDGGAAVGTGSAVSTADVINVVNANIVDSNGLILLLSALLGGEIDLRSLDLSYFFGGPAPEGCSFLSCGSTLHVNATNTAAVGNDVIVRAQTGANTASSTGDAAVGTGDAFAAANVLNLVNTTMVDSNYLLVQINNFGDLAKDIVLPTAEFFQRLLAGGSAPSALSADATNGANVDNTLAAGANSGDNAAILTGTSTPGGASVETGNAGAFTNAFNQVNTTAVGGTSVFFLFRIMGEWTGTVQGLPPGLTWRQTPAGIVLETAGAQSPLAALSGSGDRIASDVNNAATVRNNIQAWALTGGNRAISQEGSASVRTGDAYAAASVVNLVNTTILGRNWIFAIFNIFGNWSGNIAFGRPDLWIGSVAQTPQPIHNGATVTYRFTVANRGDADASNVTLDAVFDKRFLAFAGAEDTLRGARFALGAIPRGSARDFIFSAKVTAPEGSTVTIPLTATVRAFENDNFPGDNTDMLALALGTPTAAWNGGVWTQNANMALKSSASVGTTTAPAPVNFTIAALNDTAAGPSYESQLVNTIYGPSGKQIAQKKWNLGTVKPGEEVKVTYTIQFGTTTVPGTYRSEAKLTGRQNSQFSLYAVDATPAETHALVHVLPPQSAEVPEAVGGGPEGVTSVAACGPLLSGFIRLNGANDAADVAKLQAFLTVFESDPLGVTGEFDPGTVAAVMRFQEKYRADVLGPWGAAAPTGNVLFTTRKKINELYCGDGALFPLSAEELAGIARVR